MREIVCAFVREGCTGLTRGTRGRWWELGLSCGHTVERRVKYRQTGERFHGPYHTPPLNHVLPMTQKRTHCEFCGRGK